MRINFHQLAIFAFKKYVILDADFSGFIERGCKYLLLKIRNPLQFSGSHHKKLVKKYVIRTLHLKQGCSESPLIELDKIEIKGAGISLWFRVIDADALFSKVVMCQTPIINPIQNGPFGRVFVLEDPDGYAITIHGTN